MSKSALSKSPASIRWLLERQVSAFERSILEVEAKLLDGPPWRLPDRLCGCLNDSFRNQDDLRKHIRTMH